MQIVPYIVHALGKNLDLLKWDVSPYETFKKRVRLFTKPVNEVNRRKFVLPGGPSKGPRFNLVNFKFNPVEKVSPTQYKIEGSTGLTDLFRFRYDSFNPIHRTPLNHILIELSINFPDIIFVVITQDNSNKVYKAYIKNKELYDPSRKHVVRFNKDHKEEENYYLSYVNISNGNIYIDGGYKDKPIILPTGSFKAIQPEQLISITSENPKPVYYLPVKVKVIGREHNSIIIKANSLNSKNRKFIEEVGPYYNSQFSRYNLEPYQPYLIINSLGVVDKFVANTSGILFDKEINYWRNF